MSTSQQNNIENVGNSYNALTLNLMKEIFCHTLGFSIHHMDDLGDSVLCKINQSQNDKCCLIPLYEEFKVVSF